MRPFSPPATAADSQQLAAGLDQLLAPAIIVVVVHSPRDKTAAASDADALHEDDNILEIRLMIIRVTTIGQRNRANYHLSFLKVLVLMKMLLMK